MSLIIAMALSPALASAENVLRMSAPIVKAEEQAPPPVVDQGTPPSRDGLLMLFRFENSLAREGSSSLSLGFYGGSPTFSQSSPVSDQHASLQMVKPNGISSTSGPLSGAGDYSVGTWIKTTQTAQAYLISQRDAQNTGQFVLFMYSGKLCFWDYPGGTATKTICAPSIINDGTWNHIGLARQNGTLKLYVNGALEYSGYFAPNMLRTDNGLTIGYDQRDRNSYFNGNLKDLFVFQRALNDSEWLWLAKNLKPFPIE